MNHAMNHLERMLLNGEPEVRTTLDDIERMLGIPPFPSTLRRGPTVGDPHGTLCGAAEVSRDCYVGSFRLPGLPAGDTFFVILEPNHGPPTVGFNTLAHCQAAAADLAARVPGKRFYIMRSVEVAFAEIPKPPVTLTPIV